MENNKPVRKRRKRLPTLLIVFLVIYIFLQLYLVKANKIETVKANEGYINDSILTNGIVCREEVVLNKPINGIIHYIVEDGNRLSSGMTIGEVYSSYNDILNLDEAEKIAHQLENVSIAKNFMSNTSVDISITRKQLNNQIINLASYMSSQSYAEMENVIPELTLNLNKMNVATGKNNDFTSIEVELQEKLSTAKANITPAIDTLNTQTAGYFLSYTDGYESIATVDNFLNKSVDEGMDIITNPIQYTKTRDNYAKIITDYNWSVCAYVPNEVATNLTVNRNVRISTDILSGNSQKAVIKHIVPFEDKTLVVVECAIMDKNSASKRITDCEILFNQYKGIKIPKSALHIVDEQMGVYIKYSKIVQFKKVKPIFEDNNYIVVPMNTTSENEVSLYDEVIVKGRNLYNGKYI